MIDHSREQKRYCIQVNNLGEEKDLLSVLPKHLHVSVLHANGSPLVICGI